MQCDATGSQADCLSAETGSIPVHCASPEIVSKVVHGRRRIRDG